MNPCNNVKMTIILYLSIVAISVIQAAPIPPDPDNAALRYYQACLLYANVDKAADGLLSDVAAGRKPVNDEIRKHISNCSSSISIITEAAEMDKCVWGVKYSNGFDAQLPHLGQTRQLTRLLLADARIQAADGNISLAFKRCLSARKLARHVGDDMLVSFLVSVAVDDLAGRSIADLLGSTKLQPADCDALAAAVRKIGDPPFTMTRSLNVEKDIALKSMTMDTVGTLVQAANPDLTDAQAKEMVKKRGGEKFLTENRKYYSSFMGSMDRIVNAGKPYTETHNLLRDLTNSLAKDKDNPAAMLTNIAAPSIARIYDLQITAQTATNALLAGIEIHKIRARTGNLPARLPAGLPKELFSGKDFTYQPTKTGFSLTCQGKDLSKDTFHKYEFELAG